MKLIKTILGKQSININLMQINGYFLLFILLMVIQNVYAEVTLEKTWFSTIGFEENSFSPNHTYGISNSKNQNTLYDLKTGTPVFQIDTTKMLITDFNGKTFFVMDSINRKFYVYDLSNLNLIKELTYRNYITNRSFKDSLLFEFDTDNQIITLWNIYDDKIIMTKDLKSATNYPAKMYKYVSDYSYDGRFLRFSEYKYSYDNYIYDTINDDFFTIFNMIESINLKSKFMNQSNNIVFIEKMKIGNDTIESDYLRFFDLNSRTYFKDIKVMQYRNRISRVAYILVSSNDDYILYYILSDFFNLFDHNIYDIKNDKFNDKVVYLSNPGIYFGNNILIDFSNQAYRVKTPTSISDNFQNKYNLFPNPAGDFITISCGSIGACSNDYGASPIATVQIFNTLGIEVSSAGRGMSEVDGGGYRIDVSHLPAGVYYVRITGSNGACSIVEKFLKM